MYLRSFIKVEIAVKQIDTAIDIYMNGQDLFSVITLAAAGEEILGRLLERSNQRTALKNNAEALLAVHEEINKKRPDFKDVLNSLNRAKNSIKHMNATEDDTVIMDPSFEAEAMLYRAIENYYALTGQFTKKMDAYYNKVYFSNRA